MTFQRPAIQTTLLALLATGCVATHSADDASTSDAPVIDASATDAPTPDAARLPDAFVCPDGDGDGETDARCGGPDCDDADRDISSTRTLCASPTSVTRCEGAMRVDAACDSATPYCDARTNGCVADACGDRVVHSNEQCDDGRDMTGITCADCIQGCAATPECVGGRVCRPYLSADYGRMLPGCAAPNPGGAAMGTRCTANSECYSGLCDATEARCTESAFGPTSACDAPHRWPRHEPLTEEGGMYAAPDSVCQFECEHDTDCGTGATCVLAAYRSFAVGVCISGWRRGAALPGESCFISDHECASGICIFQRCSQMCRTNSDCDSATPNCVAADLTMPPPGGGRGRSLTPRPADWGTRWPGVCLP
jgi:hypothetical protein